jgi:DNA repair exonuclease SbcCD ATPase subunit
LEKFNFYFEHAKEKRTAFESEINVITRLKTDTQTRLAECEQTLSKQEGSTAQLRAVKEVEIENLKKHSAKQVEQFQTSKLTLEDEIKLIQEDLKSNPQEHLKDHNSIRSTLNQLRRIGNDLHSLQHISGAVTSKKECPSCGQSISNMATVLSKTTQSLENSISRLTPLQTFIQQYLPSIDVTSLLFRVGKKDDLQLEQIETNIKDFLLKLNHDAEALEKALDHHQRRNQNLDKLKMKLLELDKTILQVENDKQRRLSKLEAEIAALDSVVAQREQLTQLTLKQKEDLEKQLQQYESQLPDLNHNYQVLKFWELAFDKVISLLQD